MGLTTILYKRDVYMNFAIDAQDGTGQGGKALLIINSVSIPFQSKESSVLAISSRRAYFSDT